MSLKSVLTLSTLRPYCVHRMCEQEVNVSVVSRGDSTLRGHFPSDLAALEAGMGGKLWTDDPLCLYAARSRSHISPRVTSPCATRFLLKCLRYGCTTFYVMLWLAAPALEEGDCSCCEASFTQVQARARDFSIRQRRVDSTFPCLQCPLLTAVSHDAWIVAPFFKAGGRITAGDVHFVEQSDGSDTALVPAGETEFARDAAFGYKSSNLVDWVKEKAAAEGLGLRAGGGRDLAAVTEHVTSVSLQDLREGGPAAVRKRLAEARGGCVVVNALEERDLQVSGYRSRRFFDIYVYMFTY